MTITIDIELDANQQAALEWECKRENALADELPKLEEWYAAQVRLREAAIQRQYMVQMEDEHWIRVRNDATASGIKAAEVADAIAAKAEKLTATIEFAGPAPVDKMRP